MFGLIIFFYVLFLEKTLLIHTLNFNHSNVSCSSSTLLCVVSLLRQYCPFCPPPPGKRAGAQLPPVPAPLCICLVAQIVFNVSETCLRVAIHEALLQCNLSVFSPK